MKKLLTGVMLYLAITVVISAFSLSLFYYTLGEIDSNIFIERVSFWFYFVNYIQLFWFQVFYYGDGEIYTVVFNLIFYSLLVFIGIKGKRSGVFKNNFYVFYFLLVTAQFSVVFFSFFLLAAISSV